jgi:hypothetical protein
LKMGYVKPSSTTTENDDLARSTHIRISRSQTHSPNFGRPNAHRLLLQFVLI